MYVGFFGGVDDFFHGSAGLAVGDVFPDSAAEQVDILLNDADLTAQGLQGQGAHILPVDGDPSAGHVIKTGQKIADGGLSASGGAYQSNGFSSRDLEGNVGKHRRVVVAVMEGDIFIGNMSLHVRKRPGVRRILDVRIRFHDGDKTPEAGHALLNHFRQFHQDLNRTDENSNIKGIHGEVSDLHLPFGDQISAEYQGDEIHHALEKQVPAHEASHAFIVGVLGKQETVIAFPEFFPFHILIGKGLYHADARQGILQAGVDVADFFPVIHEGELHSLILA